MLQGDNVVRFLVNFLHTYFIDLISKIIHENKTIIDHLKEKTLGQLKIIERQTLENTNM